jgi:hypothetical protein
VSIAVTPIVEPNIPVDAAPFFSCLINSKGNVNNDGASIINGAICGESSVNGFPPGTALAIHNGDETATNDLVNTQNVYDYVFNQCANVFPLAGPVANVVLTPGTYCFSGATTFGGTVTLQGDGDGGVFYIVIDGGLTTLAGSSIVLDGAAPTDVFFAASGQTTLGDSTLFQGILINDQSILTIGTGVTVIGTVKNLGASLSIGEVTASAP